MSILKNYCLSKMSKLSTSEQEVIMGIIDSILALKNEWQDLNKSQISHFEKIGKMAYLTRTLLGPNIEALLVKADNGLFAVDPEDYGVGWVLRNRGIYGALELEYVERYITKKSKVLIVGAHIGTLLIPLSRLCELTIGIEANPYTFELLKTNVLINHITNCEIYNIAASDNDEDISFLLNKLNSGGSKRKPIFNSSLYDYDNPIEIRVPGTRLDTYLSQKIFDIIIMDLEGSEYFALKGMTDILKNVKILVLEFVPHHLKNVSNVSVKDLLELLPPFKYLTLPSKQIRIPSKNFLTALNYMYENDIAEDGIIFERD